MNRLRALLAWIVGHAVIVLVIIGVITAFFAGVIIVKGVPETKNPTEKVLIRTLDSTQFYNKFVKMFGKDELILIVVKAPPGTTVFDPKVFAVVDDITARIAGIPDPSPDEAYEQLRAALVAELVKGGLAERKAEREADRRVGKKQEEVRDGYEASLVESGVAQDEARARAYQWPEQQAEAAREALVDQLVDSGLTKAEAAARAHAVVSEPVEAARKRLKAALIKNRVPEEDAIAQARGGINARFQLDEAARLVKSGMSEADAKARAAALEPVSKVVGLTDTKRELFAGLRAKQKLLAFVPGMRQRLSDHEAFFREFVKNIHLFSDNLVNEELEATTVTLILRSNAEDVVGYVDEVVKAANAELQPGGGEARLVYQIGSPVIADQVVEFLKDDLHTLSGFTVGLIVIILAVCFRNVRGVVLPLVSAGIAFVWTFGLMSLLGAYLNMITVVIPTLLIAIGNAYALHVVSEFFEEASEGRPAAGGRRLKKEIVTSTLFKVSLPVFLAGATTLIGFGSLALNDIDMIREFAFFSCFGLLALIILSLTLLPALLALLPLPKQKKGKKAAGEAGASLETKRSPVLWFLRRLHNLDVRGQVFVYIAAVVVIALAIGLPGVGGLLNLKVENAVISFFKSDAAVRTNFKDIQQVMAGCYTINVVMEYRGPENVAYFQEPTVLHQIDDLQQRVVAEDPGIDMAISLVEYLKMANAVASPFNYEKQVLPDTSDAVKGLVAQFPVIFGKEQTEIKQVVTDDYKAVNIIFRAHFEGAREFVLAKNEILRLCGRNPKGVALKTPPPDAIPFSKDLDIHVTGLPLVVSESANAITQGQVKSLSLAFICIFIIMTALFMSVRVGFVAMIPNVFPILINYGVMGWTGIALSSATSLIASIALGIAVDDTIHYLARYNGEFKKDFDKKRAMKASLLTAGQPIVFTSITLGIAFAVLLVSKFQPTIYFGLLMMITMITALFGSLIILPVLMLRIELVTLWDVVSLRVGEAPRAFIDLFRDMSRWQVRKVMAAAGLQKYAKGTRIVKEGEVGDTMYAIISGSVEVVRGEGAEAHKVAALERGQIFGEMALVLKEPRSATVVTAEETELLRFNERTLRRIRGRFPRLAVKLYRNLTKILGARVKLTTDKLHEALGAVPPEKI